MNNSANPASNPAIAEYHPAEAAMSKATLESRQSITGQEGYYSGARRTSSAQVNFLETIRR
jgi:hypothetical protein